MFLQINLIPWVRSPKKLESPKFLGNVQTQLETFSSLGNVETSRAKSLLELEKSTIINSKGFFK